MTIFADISARHSFVVTGATGYIGSHFVAALASCGATVAVLGRPCLTVEMLARLPAFGGNVERVRVLSHSGDPEALAKALSDVPNPIVIHLAGLFVSAHSPGDVAPLIASNIGFSALLMEAMRLSALRKLVNVGTLWEYGPSGEYAPVNLYAATKHATTALLEYYVQAEGFSVLSLKLLDTYGRNDSRRKLMPLLREMVQSGDSLDMSSGHQKINLTHVDDICRALVASAAQVADGVSGHSLAATLSSEELSIREVASLMESVSGRKLNTRWGARPDSARQQPQPWSGISGPMGWSPSVSLKDGLQRYVKDVEPSLETVFHV